MRPTYRRFYELIEKAQHKLRGSGTLEQRLTNAVIEINMLHEDEVPEHSWGSVQLIIDSCQTHKAEGDEGVFRASINKMTSEGQESLKRAIEFL